MGKGKMGKVYCICRKSVGKSWMIFCEICTDWFHKECVGVTCKREELPEFWCCPRCDNIKNWVQKEVLAINKQMHQELQHFRKSNEEQMQAHLQDAQKEAELRKMRQLCADSESELSRVRDLCNEKDAQLLELQRSFDQKQIDWEKGRKEQEDAMARMQELCEESTRELSKTKRLCEEKDAQLSVLQAKKLCYEKDAQLSHLVLQSHHEQKESEVNFKQQGSKRGRLSLSLSSNSRLKPKVLHSSQSATNALSDDDFK